MGSRHCDEIDLGYMFVLAVAAVALLFQSAWLFMAGLVQAVVAESIASDAVEAAAASLISPTAVVPESMASVPLSLVLWRDAPPSKSLTKMLLRSD